MVNAWSLAASILDGTFEEDYPLMNKSKKGWSEEDDIRELDDYYDFKNVGTGNTAHSDYYYDYNRNDPDAENPFTEAFDYLMGESVTGKHLGYMNHLMVVKLFTDMNVELIL